MSALSRSALAACALMLVFPSCKSSSSSGIDPAPSATGTAAPARTGRPRDLSDPIVQSLVTAWSHALDTHDVAALGPMYAPRVRFYGKEVPRATVLAAKAHALGPTSTFHQDIVGEIRVSVNDDATYLATFTMRSGTSTRTDVTARVSVSRMDGGTWQIVEETDEVTVARAARKTRYACPELASDVVNELPVVKKLLADTRKEIDAHYTDRFLGGIGPIQDENGFQAGLGVHQPERYEALVWYTVTTAGDLTVTVSGNDVAVPEARRAAVKSLCGTDGGP
jgi:ketosteroid isomerase-like protein